jgi:hypothetical protein
MIFGGMVSEETNISQWAPVLGTLGGAILGFLASFLTAIFSKSRESKEQREERDRRRIERIYELLIFIAQENVENLGSAINWIHYARPISDKTGKGIPPLVELEMLVSLYFGELESHRKNLMGAIQKFGKRYFEIRSEDFRAKDKPYKQEIAGEFVTMQSSVETQIAAFKSKVSEIVKS